MGRGAIRSRWRLSVVMILVPWLTILSSCKLVAPSDSWFGDIAWLSDGHVYYVLNVDEAPNEVHRISPDKGGPTKVDISTECTAKDYNLRSLASGAMAVSAHCYEPMKTELLTYDGVARRWGPDAPGYGRAVWESVSGRGYIESIVASKCRSLRKLSENAKPLWIEATPEPLRADRLLDEPACPDSSPDVGWPLPTDNGLYFLASPDAAGLDGESRRLAPWTLYHADADGVAQPVVRGFVDIRGAALSPDGRTLMVAAKRDNLWALWKVNLGGRVVSRHAEGPYGSVTFSPDGERLAAVLHDMSGRDRIKFLTP